MGIDYALIAQFLIYFGVVNLFTRLSLNPIVAGLIASIGVFAVGFTIDSILHVQYDTSPLDLLLSPITLIQMILQVVIGIATFGFLKQYEDSVTAHFVISIIGGVLLLFIAPAVALRLT